MTNLKAEAFSDRIGEGQVGVRLVDRVPRGLVWVPERAAGFSPGGFGGCWGEGGSFLAAQSMKKICNSLARRSSR